MTCSPLTPLHHVGPARRIPRTRLFALILSLPALLLGACTSLTDVAEPNASSTQVTGRITDGSRDGIPSALDDPSNPEFPEPLIDLAEIVSGGPAPDGIPPIDEPTFEIAAEVDWLEDNEAVLALTVMEETRAYPVRIMMWHEIVNDRVGGVDVAVTYCPLCNSGVAFERAVDGEGVLSFGTSGMLYADNLVMYDRQTESLWPQLTGVASVGVLTGTELTSLPMGAVAWRDFVDAHPNAGVLSQETGINRSYGDNPYFHYDDPDGDVMFGLPSAVDDRLRVKERVIGLTDGDTSLALVRSALADHPPMEVTLGSVQLIVWHQPGQASALDANTVAGGADIGSVGVFDRVVDGQSLDFDPHEDGFVDRQTGSTWNVLGQATAGPLMGEQLSPHVHLDTFWFAWVAFHPDTAVIEPGK